MDGVNWIAVIVGAIVAFLYGWGWYSPKLMGTKWAKGSNVEINTDEGIPTSAMVAQFIGLFLMSWFVSLMAAGDKLATVILATAAFTIMAWAGSTFSKKSMEARNIDSGYWIISLIIMIIANAIF